jgi:hypothetical protein
VEDDAAAISPDWCFESLSTLDPLPSPPTKTPFFPDAFPPFSCFACGGASDASFLAGRAGAADDEDATGAVLGRSPDDEAAEGRAEKLLGVRAGGAEVSGRIWRGQGKNEKPQIGCE